MKDLPDSLSYILLGFGGFLIVVDNFWLGTILLLIGAALLSRKDKPT